IDAHLAQAREAAARCTDESGPLYRFLVDSFAFERDFQKDPTMDLAVFQKRFDAACKGFNDYKVIGDSTGESRLYGCASRIWQRALYARLNPGEKDSPSYFAAMAMLRRMRARTWDLARQPNPEYMLAALDFNLDWAERQREFGQRDDASNTLAGTE